MNQHCRTGCRTRDHRSYGECLRASHIGVNLQVTPSNAWDAELNAYASAKAQGVSPAGTTMAKVRQAMDISDATGVAYDAATDGSTS
jgi:hypothetical protein